MNECSICKRDEKSVKLVDAVCENEVTKICEECAFLEGLPVIRKPSSFQLEASEKPYSVRERLARMAGVRLKDESRSDIKAQAGVCDVRNQITLDKLRKPKDYNKIMSERFEQVKKSNKPVELIDNWNWHIQMARRNRKLTLSQISSIISEPEIALKMIESGSLPDDYARIIAKIEQFFKINLRKSEFEKEQARIEEVKQPARILNFDRDSLNKITLSDLKKMKEAREKEEAVDAENIAWKREKSGKKEIIGSDVEIIDDD